VAELSAWGGLERGADGRYRIGLRLWEVGALAPRGLGLREAAMPFLEDLYEVTKQNVQLAVLDGTEVVYLERLSGRPKGFGGLSGAAATPMHATGVGLVQYGLLRRAEGKDQIQVPGKDRFSSAWKNLTEWIKQYV